jgi:TolB-like protein
MRGFIEELRYRNVFRVAIAYVVAGWLVAQVVDLAADAFNAPDWVMQMLIVLLLIGLPVALFLAWAYELTPDGVKKAKDLPEDAPKDPRSGRILNRITLVALVVAVAWLGWDKLQRDEVAPVTEAMSATSVEKSVAVLPFADFSPDGDHGWFADGLTEEILNSLTRVSDLEVASRTSSFNFRGSTEDIPAIAAQLGVAHILEGSVRRSGDQLRITAQLIRATDDKHLWSENFDGTIDNSIAIQEEIATQIARALQTAMDPDELARMIAAGTRSVEAWEIYLRALALQADMYARVDSSMVFNTADTFAAAVAIDPAFVDAHDALANLWFLQLDVTTTAHNPDGPPYAERRARFDAAVDATIRHARTEVDRLSAEFRKAAMEVRLTDQVRIAERILELDPDNLSAQRNLLELYQLSGRRDEARQLALALWKQPDELDAPDSPAATVIFEMRRLDIDEAVRLAEEGLADPKVTTIFYYQAHRAFLDAGLTERAAELVDAYMLRSADEDGIPIVQIRQACAEGRVADADALFDQSTPEANSRWLMLKTLGRHDEAREELRRYETPEYLFILAGFLDYRTFEPRDYPLLWRTMQAQGIDRPPARAQTFECKRDA